VVIVFGACFFRSHFGSSGSIICERCSPCAARQRMAKRVVLVVCGFADHGRAINDCLNLGFADIDVTELLPRDPGMGSGKGSKKGDHPQLVDDVVGQTGFEDAVKAVVAATRTAASFDEHRSVLVKCRRGKHRSPVVAAVAGEVLNARNVEVRIVELALCKYWLISPMVANLLLWANHSIDYDVKSASSYGCFLMEELCETRQARGNLQLCFRMNAKIPKVDLSSASSQSATAPPAASAQSAASASTTPVHKAAPIGASRLVSPAAAPRAVPTEPPTAEAQAKKLASLKEQLAMAQKKEQLFIAEKTLKQTEVAQKILLPTSKAGPQQPSAAPPANLLKPRVVAPPQRSSSSSSAAEPSSHQLLSHPANLLSSSLSRPDPSCLSEYDYWVINACALDKEAHIYKQCGVFKQPVRTMY
jgi:hypothetical protein